jgi:hypothetical protein
MNEMLAVLLVNIPQGVNHFIKTISSISVTNSNDFYDMLF